MALESATYIQSLASSNPPAGDPVSQAADHIRLIKSVLLATFPNLSAAVTATPIQLNSNTVPVGGIILWAGSLAGIPAGWALCNGSTFSRLDGAGSITTPNLQDKFIVGAGASYGVYASGGGTTHGHNITIGGTNLAQSHIPNLSIGINDPGHNHGVNDPGHSHVNNSSGNWGAAAGGVACNVYVGGSRNTASTTGIYLTAAATGISAYTSATGGGVGVAHSHAGSADVQYNLPPYYALAYIMKL